MNKILIHLYVPVLDREYDIFLPTGKKVGIVCILLEKAISELTDGAFPLSNSNELYDKNTGISYTKEIFISATNIRNGSELIFA